MSLRTQQHYVLEVRVIDVCVYTEEPLKYHLYYVHKIFGEWDT